MSRQSPAVRVPRRQFAKRVLRYPARIILAAIMSLAVTVAERRIRKALRAGQ
jgi:hypothetical protein